MEVFETIHIGVAILVGIGFLFVLIMLVWIPLEDKNNPENKNSKGCMNFIIAAVIVVVVFMLMGMCSGNGGNWEPRHTKLQEPVQNNVNCIIFSPNSYSMLG